MRVCLLKGLYWACEPFVYTVRLVPICCSLLFSSSDFYFILSPFISFFLKPKICLTFSLTCIFYFSSLVLSLPLFLSLSLSLSLSLCGSVSITSSPAAALRTMAPFGGADDGYNLFSTRGVLTFIQSTTRRAYQQVLEVLDENQRRWPLTSDPWICPDRLI